MTDLLISVIGRGDAVKAAIKSGPGNAAAVLDMLAIDPRAGPGVLLDKDERNIPASEDMLQPGAGPFKYLLQEGRPAQLAGQLMRADWPKTGLCRSRFAAHTLDIDVSHPLLGCSEVSDSAFAPWALLPSCRGRWR